MILARILKIVAYIQVFDLIYQGLLSILKGLGKQVTAAKIAMTGFLLVGAPLCFVFAFLLKYQLVGLWYAMGCALGFNILCFTLVLVRSDWEHKDEVGCASKEPLLGEE